MASELVPEGDIARRVGSYEIESRIAFGGMAEIFLAWQKGPSGFKRKVVLKRILPQFASDPHFVEMFVNEALIASSLSHPNIAHIYELIEDGPDYFLVMEYIQGWTVRDVLREVGVRKELIPLPFVAKIITSICEALDYAYNEPGPDGQPRGVIHRDVTPTNVLVCPDGQVKLVDFGIAKAMRSAENLTKSKTLKGKYPYMAPEQLRGETVDHRSDIFSVGVMMHEMCLGRRLFRRDGDMATIKAVLEENVVPPSQLIPDFPPDLEHIVLRALERDPDRRYGASRKLAASLKRCAQAHEWNLENRSFGRFLRTLFGELTAVDEEDSDVDSDVTEPQAVGLDDFPQIEVQSIATLPNEGEHGQLLASAQVPGEQPGGLAHEYKWLVLFLLLAVASAVFWTVILP